MAFNSWFRRNQKKVFVLMIFAMGAWGIGSSAMFFIPEKSVGTIAGENIRRDELADFDARWRRIILSRLRGPLQDIVWKQMIFEREAQRTGIVITEEDVVEGIYDLATQMFGQKPATDVENLIRVLCGNFNVNRGQLIRTIEEVMRIHKMDHFMKSAIKVTTEEAWQRYALENEKVKIKYVSFDATDFVDSANVTDTEIEEFYNKHKDVIPDKQSGTYGYMEPNKIRVEYVLADFNALESRVEISDDELKKYYDENKENEFKKIVDKKADESENVEDKNEEKPEESEAFKSFDEVREIIASKLKKVMARNLADELISKVDEDIYEGIDKVERPLFKDLAAKYGLIYNIPKSKSGKEYITSKEAEALLVGTDRFASLAFNREENDPSPPLSALMGKYVFQVTGKKTPETPPLSDVKDKVEADLKLEMALRIATESAEKCLAMMKSSSFKEGLDSYVADASGKTPKTGETDYLSRPRIVNNRQHSYVAALKAYRPNVVAKAFKLRDDKIIELVTEDEGKKVSYLITLVDKKDAERKVFDKKFSDIARTIGAEKQRYILSKWEDKILKQAELDI